MNAHRTVLVLFAIVLGSVIAIAFVTTFHRIHTQQVSVRATSGTIGLAKSQRSDR